MHRDIRQLEPAEIAVNQIDFIIGGPPCQSFSAIGRRAGGIDGIRDERGSLFEHYCRLVQHYQPKGFLFENVRGILGANQGKDWQFIIDAFAQLGYQLFYRVLDCADYGVPQQTRTLNPGWHLHRVISNFLDLHMVQTRLVRNLMLVH